MIILLIYYCLHIMENCRGNHGFKHVNQVCCKLTNEEYKQVMQLLQNYKLVVVGQEYCLDVKYLQGEDCNCVNSFFKVAYIHLHCSDLNLNIMLIQGKYVLSDFENGQETFDSYKGLIDTLDTCYPQLKEL